MKNLKKALALTIAAVSVFGTIASAEMSFVNPQTYSFPLITESGTNGRGSVQKDYYDYTLDEDGVLTMEAKSTVTDYPGYMSSYRLNSNGNGAYLNLNGTKYWSNAEVASSYGKIKAVLEFSFYKTSNTSVHPNGYGYNSDPGGISLMTAVYKDSANAWDGNSFTTPTVWMSPQDDSYALHFYDTSGKYYVGNANHKLRMIKEFDPATKTCETYLYDAENETSTKPATLLWKRTATLPEGATPQYVVPSLGLRSKPATTVKVYKYEITREAIKTENEAITVDSNVNATVDVYADTDCGKNATDTQPVSIILAQYDANGRLLDCTSASGEYKRVAKNGDQAQERRGGKTTLTASMAKADDYSYAKVFVWDSTAAMTPLAEVYSNKTVD